MADSDQASSGASNAIGMLVIPGCKDQLFNPRCAPGLGDRKHRIRCRRGVAKIHHGAGDRTIGGKGEFRGISLGNLSRACEGEQNLSFNIPLASILGAAHRRRRLPKLTVDINPRGILRVPGRDAGRSLGEVAGRCRQFVIGEIGGEGGRW